MAPVNQLKLDIDGVPTQDFWVRFRLVQRIIFILPAGDVENRSADWLIRAVVPVAGKSTTDRDHAPDRIRG